MGSAERQMHLHLDAGLDGPHPGQRPVEVAAPDHPHLLAELVHPDPQGVVDVRGRDGVHDQQRTVVGGRVVRGPVESQLAVRGDVVPDHHRAMGVVRRHGSTTRALAGSSEGPTDLVPGTFDPTSPTRALSAGRAVRCCRKNARISARKNDVGRTGVEGQGWGKREGVKREIGWRRRRRRVARSARISPTTGANLKPWPENPAATVTVGVARVPGDDEVLVRGGGVHAGHPAQVPPGQRRQPGGEVLGEPGHLVVVDLPVERVRVAPPSPVRRGRTSPSRRPRPRRTPGSRSSAPRASPPRSTPGAARPATARSDRSARTSASAGARRAAAARGRRAATAPRRRPRRPAAPRRTPTPTCGR